jgi:hypothetical protein
MEEGKAPGELKSVFSNIENNGAPWQYSPETDFFGKQSGNKC